MREGDFLLSKNGTIKKILSMRIIIQKLDIKDFFSSKRIYNIFKYTLSLFLLTIIFLGQYFDYETNYNGIENAKPLKFNIIENGGIIRFPDYGNKDGGR